LDYSPIEGTPCTCVPSPWTGIFGTEEIDAISEFSSCTNVPVESPSGGNVIGLNVFPSITEGITYTWTGLNPGTEYTFVIWWLSLTCNIPFNDCCADLWIVADGVDYIYSAVDDWTLVDICIEAQSSSITIDIQGIAGGTDGYLLLDDASCSDSNSSCCGLQMEVPDDFETCPNEATEILGTYQGETGTVNFEWTSDPPDGINYLDDTSIENPAFEFTTTDENFGGTSYIFTFSGEDDACQAAVEIEIELLGFESVSFAFEDAPMCSNQGIFELPQTSNEGVNGTWDITAILPSDFPGQQLSFMFTPFNGEVVCPIASTHLMEIQTFAEPTFNFLLEYCRGQTNIVALPQTSIEGIEGTWNYIEIDVDLFPDGITDIIFTPDDLFCQGIITLELEIFSGQDLDFDLPLEYCATYGILNFPSTSLDGVDGTWDYNQLDLANNLGSNTNIFTAFDNGIDCYNEYEYVFEVMEELTPNFTLNTNLCSDDDPLVLPTISDEGYLGTWSMAIIDPTAGNASSTWIADLGQSDCITELSINFQIDPSISPSFTLPTDYCDDSGIFTFPITSDEGIQGNWTIDSFDPLTFGTSEVVSTFTPLDNFCAQPFEWTINILQAQSLNFNLPNEFCSTDGILTFPTTTTDGVDGTWSYDQLDLTVNLGTNTNTFTAIDNGVDCFTEFEFVFEVIEELSPSFSLNTNLCSSDDPLFLPANSDEGFLGTWDISTIDPALGNTNATWTANPGQSDCLTELTINFQVDQAIIPSFNLPTDYCINGSIFTFPTSSEEGIQGLWNIDSFDPLTLATAQITSTFTPLDNFCADSFDWIINIIQPQNPDFDLPLTICESDAAFTLPISSQNNIDGIWTVAEIDPNGMAGNTISASFIPAQDCSNIYEYNIEVTSATATIFNLPTYLCWDDQDSVLPTVSLENIEGSWSQDVLEIEENLGTAVQLIFTPDGTSCYTTSIVEIFVVDQINKSFDINDPTDCSVTNGSIIIQNPEAAEEYSIDNGTTWQTSGNFSDLNGGNYTVLVRSTLYTDCISEFQFIITSPNAPMLGGILSTNIDNCDNDNGEIIIQASGNNLEYSIDGGTTWFMNNQFTNLSAGNYAIAIREEGTMDCVVEGSSEILAFPQTIIEQVIEMNVSDCDSQDGLIQILATGQNLEFSIDGGINWSPNNSFDNLPFGEYEIMVRSSDAIDCIDTDEVILNAPETVIIENVETQEPTDCEPATGSILVEATGMNLEYSIDSGQNWQDNPLFENIAAGIYMVVARNSLLINCYDESIETLSSIPDNLGTPNVIIQNTSACDLNDGSIEFELIDPEIEYSIDGGNTWSDSNLFENLAAGNYDLQIRMKNAPACIGENTAIVENPDCPCPDLDVEFEVTQADCNNPETASIELISVTGMESPSYEINWDNGLQDEVLNMLSEGWYVVEIAYDQDCLWLDSVYIEGVEVFSAEVITQTSFCENDNNGFVQFTNITGGTEPYTILYQEETYTEVDNIENLGTGLHEFILEDDEGCQFFYSITFESNFELISPLPDTILVDVGEVISLDPGFDQMSIDSFEWNANPQILNPGDFIVEVLPIESGLYTLTVYVESCEYQLDIYLENQNLEIEIPDIYIPNVFTPNGDGDNDEFYPQSTTSNLVEIIEFSIYDRWGNLIFTSDSTDLNDPSIIWDGRFKGTKVNPGVYVYKLEYVDDQGSSRMVGSVTVLE